MWRYKLSGGFSYVKCHRINQPLSINGCIVVRHMIDSSFVPVRSFHENCYQNWSFAKMLCAQNTQAQFTRSYRRIIINICAVRWDLRRSLGMRARFSFVRILFFQKRQEYRSWVCVCVCLSKAHKQPSSTSISWGQCTFYSFIRCNADALARGSLFLNSRTVLI